MSVDRFIDTFIAECHELLGAMESELLAMERGTASDEAVNAVFRAAHTIKGSAGMFGFDALVSFTHVVETLLDRLRSGQMTATPALLALLLDSQAHISDLVEDVSGGGDGQAPALVARDTALVERLRAAMDSAAAGSTPVQAAASAQPVPAPAAAGERDAWLVRSNAWHVSVRYQPYILMRGLEPLTIVRNLAALGSDLNVQMVDDALPAADAFDPEQCYVGFEISFRSEASKEEIEGAFEFVRDDCALTILPPRSRVADYVRLIGDMPESNARLGEILVQCGSLTRDELEQTLKLQADIAAFEPAATPLPTLGELLVDQKFVQAPVVEAALEKQRQGKERSGEKRSVRVDADKLDRLIDLVGELIIAGATTQTIAQRAKLAELNESVSQMSRLVEDMREQTLKLRMMPIGPTFAKFQRVVRDTALELGKAIRLEIEGAETELDKTLIEQIADPLTHLVRNALDHGIEPAALRLQRGKPAEGAVKLNAFHDSGSVVIEVSDDGGGLSRQRIVAKAQSRGLIADATQLSDAEVYDLIFAPGFSTAEQVTSLSGRGVGMDVVRRNVSKLRGTIEIDSREGQGTTMRIRLPLTLAIIDGFRIRAGRSAFIVPLDSVEECVELGAAAGGDEGGHRYIELRGAPLPFVRVREIFGVEAGFSRRESLVVIRHAGRRFGLVVDELLGEMQTVIKPLTRMCGHVTGIAGSTILGDGSIALIFDIPELMAFAQSAAVSASRTGTVAKAASCP